MKKQIYDEKNGLSYTLHGDYYLPDLELNDEEPVYGKYGIMRKQFLKEHRNARYQYLVLTGKLTEHLNQIDKEVREKVEMLVEQMAERYYHVPTKAPDNVYIMNYSSPRLSTASVKSCIKSFISSIPTLIRIVSSYTPASSIASGVLWI